MTQAAILSQLGSQGTTQGFKNRIINGAMVIDQRNAGASVTPTSTGYTLDRWVASLSVASKYSVQQSATASVGFTKSLLVTSTSAYVVGAGEIFDIRQRVEGFNIADLAWGTADAKTVTLSFQVRSSLTGTFGGSVMNADGSRCYPFTYTINSSNTFESKSVTITGCTDGTWNTDSSTGLQVVFGLGVGSTYSGTAGVWATSLKASATGATSVVGTNGATFYITGVQLEVGSSATGYEYRQYGQELALCQRYYQKLFPQAVSTFLASGFATTTTSARYVLPFPTSMRIAPTAIESSGTASDIVVNNAGAGNVSCTAAPTYFCASTMNIGFAVTVAANLVAGEGTLLRTNATTGATGYLAWSAEL